MYMLKRLPDYQLNGYSLPAEMRILNMFYLQLIDAVTIHNKNTADTTRHIMNEGNWYLYMEKFEDKKNGVIRSRKSKSDYHH
jgi:hypothetical protein